MHKAHTSPEVTAAHVADIAAWWAANASPLSSYTPRQLEAALGRSMRAVAHALELCGWHRVRIWKRSDNRRMLRVYWTPPGAEVQRPARGRPRLDVLAALSIA